MALLCQLHLLKFLKKTPFKNKKKFRKKEKSYKKFKKFKSPKSNEQKTNKKEVRCFKCGQKGHIAPNCKNKVNVLSDNEEEYYSENNTSSSETDKSQTDPEQEIEKIENCLCQVNMLTADQELLLEMIDQIEDKQAKAKYIRKVLEQQNSKPKPKINLSNAYQMKDLFQYYKKQEPATLQDLQEEVKQIKIQIEELKYFNQSMDTRIINLENQKDVLTSETNEDLETFVHSMTIVQKQRWYTKITLKINPNYQGTFIALIDSGADLNCIQEGLIPTVYFVKTSQRLSTASNDPLKVQYKIPQGHICKKGICIKTSFLLVKNISHQIVLGTPFLTQLYPFQIDSQGLRTKYNNQEILFEFIKGIEVKKLNQVQDFISLLQQKQKQVKFLTTEIKYKRTEENLNSEKVQERIKQIHQQIENNLCSSIPNAFWNRKQHMVSLPEKDFYEKQIPTKARPIQMNPELLEYCKKEIQDLLDKNLIRPSLSPWSCAAFYVQKASEIERGTLRLVINYKPLNKVLQWIRYPIPNKKDLIQRIYNATIFSKFDMKSGFWQIQIKPEDRYKTAFTVPFGHYEWNVMSFGLKNAPSEFQNMMNDIFNEYTRFSIVYIDDVLIFSNSIEEHFKHLKNFQKIVRDNGLVISATKIKLFQTNIRFLGFDIYQGQIKPITRAIDFANKFPDEIKDKTQLQRFLGSLNYVAKFYPNLRILIKPLFQRLKKNLVPWSKEHTKVVKQVKSQVKELPCLGILHPDAFPIIETDASNIGYGGILKQDFQNKISIVRFHSSVWSGPQLNYSTLKKEILAIVLCIQKFQSDVFNKKFLLRVDCKSAKEILQKDVQNLVSKQIFARWQAILYVFDFEIEFIKGSSNVLPDFLSREFLQGK